MRANDDGVLKALTALRNAELVTDRTRLDTAWADLTGRKLPPAARRSEPSAVGPCARCGQRHQRYGNAGQVFCPACRGDAS